jgi:hypothetical protein
VKKGVLFLTKWFFEQLGWERIDKGVKSGIDNELVEGTWYCWTTFLFAEGVEKQDLG